MYDQPISAEVRELLRRAYAAFNARDIDAVLSMMHQDVEWPTGMEGGYVYGHDGVRAYWTRQWNLIDPIVEPQAFSTEPDGRILVEVHQRVLDKDGGTLLDRRGSTFLKRPAGNAPRKGKKPPSAGSRGA